MFKNAALWLAGVWVAKGGHKNQVYTPSPDGEPPPKAAVAQWAPEAKRFAIGQASASLVLAVIEAESRGNSQSVGDNGASFGLGQIQIDTDLDFRRAHGMEDERTFAPVRLLQPAYNVQVLAWTLDNRIRIMGSVQEGLRAYNAGVAGSRRNGNAGLIYAAGIIARERVYRAAVA